MNDTHHIIGKKIIFRVQLVTSINFAMNRIGRNFRSAMIYIYAVGNLNVDSCYF